MDWKWTHPAALNDHLTRQWHTADHFGLLLDKFTPYAEYEYEERRSRQTGYRLGPNDLKREWLVEVLSSYSEQSPLALDVLQMSQQRWLALVESVEGHVLLPMLFTISPLIVGLGAEHVLETAITLDRNTGAPIIPGSALKGLARNVGLIDVATALPFAPAVERLEKLNALETWIAETVDLTQPEALTKLAVILEVEDVTTSDLEPVLREFQAVFGTTHHAGEIVFMDGIYIGNRLPTYGIDIMNPHYPGYYTGSLPPSDDQNPVPVPFLTVAERQPFLFAVLPRTPRTNQALLQRAGRWLLRGLERFGIGAKTAQGYGLFKRS